VKKRFSVVAAALLTVATFGAPGSATPAERTVTESYSMTSGFISWSSEGSIQMGTNWTTFIPRPGERTVSLSIDDAAEGPVVGRVFFWNTQRQNWAARDAKFCSATGRPLRVRPHEHVYVGAYIGQCDSGEISVVTTGTITATFSK
jgi:hypothetical protein